mmetsp:Transcript_9997/g.15132  ORF Transcript_9997/g.15132 Transcript_9997/m.15132 type:complete len:146 (-) Transcript_9997:2404-2841(-)
MEVRFGNFNKMKTETSQTHYLETKYSGFFINNLKSGEGCVELRDDDYNVVGWYMGRFENGVRHGIGREIIIMDSTSNINSPNQSGLGNQVYGKDRFKMTPRVFNKGHPVPIYSEGKEQIVEDILGNIDFFGFMSQVEKGEDEGSL